MMDWIFSPWPWYVSGPLIAIVMFILLYLGKNFEMSSNLRSLCTLSGADKTCDFFKIDWKAQKRNLLVVIGAIIAGFIVSNLLSHDQL